MSPADRTGLANRITSRVTPPGILHLTLSGEVRVMEQSFNFVLTSYETILAMLRTDISKEQRERLSAELKSRDRATHNQWVEVCGGEFK